LGTLSFNYEDLAKKALNPGEDWYALDLSKVEDKILKRHKDQGGLQSKILLYVSYKDEMSRGFRYDTLSQEGLLSGDVNIKKVVKLFKNFGYNITDEDITNAREKCEMEDNNEDLNEPDELNKFLSALNVDLRGGLEDIFRMYSEDGKMNVDQLKSFLQNSQHENVKDDLSTLIPRFALPEEEMGTEPYLSIYGFQNYIASTLNGIMRPDYSEVYMDMTLNVNEYFIDSSHNTYLVENQLTSPSSPEQYKKALLRGCRCVELDCWDEKGEVVVWHGGTLCTKTTFIECCKAIKENAFHTSPYPVILSLEIHVDADGQDKMARIMKNVFGDLLCDFIDCRDFSPNDLKHKILIKSKKTSKRRANSYQ